MNNDKKALLANLERQQNDEMMIYNSRLDIASAMAKSINAPFFCDRSEGREFPAQAYIIAFQVTRLLMALSVAGIDARHDGNRRIYLMANEFCELENRYWKIAELKAELRQKNEDNFYDALGAFLMS